MKPIAKQQPTAIVSKAALAPKLALLKTVTAKERIPVLGAVLIEGSEGKLILTATGLDVSLRCEVEAQVDGAFALAPKLATFDALISRAPAEVILTGGERLGVSWPGTNINLAAWTKADFPAIARVTATPWSIAATDLLQMIKQTAFAIELAESRYAIQGARWSYNGRRFEMVATDGRQLPMRTLAVPNAGEPFSVLIPAKTVGVLCKLLNGADGSLDFGHDDNHLYFKLGNTEIISARLAGEFPRIEMVTKVPLSQTVQLETAKVIDALHIYTSMLDEVTKGIKWTFSKGQLELNALAKDIGDGQTVITCNYDGETVSLGLNNVYMLNALEALDVGEFVLRFDADKNQVEVRPVGNDDYRCIVWTYRVD